MLLPLGTELAAGTLRTLASRQGMIDEPMSAEEPGKILHEIRRPPTDGRATFLPAVYYGTVDATPLWVCLLADAWRWGMPAARGRGTAARPRSARCSGMVTDGDSDGDGFLEYVDKSGRGLANQGWKDSGDSIRFADGRIAVGPVALAEVQSYAYEAALAGADLLDAFHRPGGDRWRRYAADLRHRFAEKFWCSDDLGPYPVLALDGAKSPVDAPASNMGHLLASGIVPPAQAKQIADRLINPSMSSGFGLRTMSSAAGGYSPLSYHCGSVWPHDTAIAIHGLCRAGFPAQAMVLAEGLLARWGGLRGAAARALRRLLARRDASAGTVSGVLPSAGMVRCLRRRTGAVHARPGGRRARRRDPDLPGAGRRRPGRQRLTSGPAPTWM